jgi:pimeloyl-ACP methyl ester carboxylesterase
VTTKIIRSREWSRPIAPAKREVVHARPADPTNRPPIVLVPGIGYGAWLFTEHWLEHAAARGYHAVAMSHRAVAGVVTMRTHAHDVVQVAASLPRQAVIVGHGGGALMVGHALARYPARAAVLVAPVFGGWRYTLNAFQVNPVGTLAAACGGRLRLSRGQAFSVATPTPVAKRFLGEMRRGSRRVQYQLLRGWQPERPVGAPPVLTVGSPDDKVVPRAALAAVARLYGGAPLEFPGMGHSMPVEPGWAEPIDAVLDWLDKQLA